DQPPKPGLLTVTFVPTAPATPDLVLSSGTLRLDHILVIGDAPPPMHMPPMQAVNLDVLSSGGSLTFTMLPPGVYSRVQLVFENVMLQGTWRGMPFQARLAVFRPMPVDLRSPTGKELGHDMDVTFTVGVDAGSWFAGNVLDGASPPPGGGTTLIDEQNNFGVTMELTTRVGRSFSLQ